MMEFINWFFGASILWGCVAVWLWWRHGGITTLDIRGLVATYSVAIFVILILSLIF
jgi:hypothetical protein